MQQLFAAACLYLMPIGYSFSFAPFGIIVSAVSYSFHMHNMIEYRQNEDIPSM